MPEHFDLNLLSAFAEQQLDGGEREFVLAHLSTCSACRNCLAVMRGSPHERRQRPISHTVVWLAGIAAVLCVFLLAPRSYSPALKNSALKPPVISVPLGTKPLQIVNAAAPKRAAGINQLSRRRLFWQDARNWGALSYVSLSAFDTRSRSLSARLNRPSCAMVLARASFRPEWSASSAPQPNQITLKTALGDRWISLETIPDLY